MACKAIPTNDGILQTLTGLSRNISEELMSQDWAQNLRGQSVDPQNSWKSVGSCLQFHLQKAEIGSPQSKLTKETSHIDKVWV